MGDEHTRYSFEGDVSNLAAAVQKAIDLLGRYGAEVTRMSKADFSGSAASVERLKQSFISAATQLKRLFDLSKQTGNIDLSASQDSMNGLNMAVTSLAQLMNTLDGKSSLTEADMTSMASALDVVANGFRNTNASVRQTTGIFEQLASQVPTAASGVRDKMAGLGRTLDLAFSKFRNFGAGFSNVAQQARIAGDATSNATQRIAGSAQKLLGEEPLLSRMARAWESAKEKISSAISSLIGKYQEHKKKSEETADSADKSTKKFGGLGDALRSLVSRLQETHRSSSALNSMLGALRSSTSVLNTALTALAGVSLADMLKESVTQSISYVENMNLFQVAMGRSVDEGRKFVSTMQELYGLDPSSIMRYVGNFYQLAAAIEAPDEAATAMSLGLAKMGTDISSLFNMPIEEVMDNLSSGMQGMSRAVRKYGLDIRTTTLQQTAYALGLRESVTNMSEANRQGLRYITMLRQAANTTGDFAKTIESPANQLRIMGEQIRQLGRAIGNFLLGPLTAVLPYINAVIMALRTMLTFISGALGFKEIDFGGATDQAKNLKGGLDGVGRAADAAAKKVKDLQAPFDELNVVQPQQDAASVSGSGIGSEVMDPAISKALTNMSQQFENVQMKANKARDAILAFFGFKYNLNGALQWDPKQFEANLIGRFPGWTKTIQAVFGNWTRIVSGFKSVFSALGDVAETVKSKVVGLLAGGDSKLAKHIWDLDDSLRGLSDWIEKHKNGLANLVLIFAGLSLALRGIQALSAIEPLVKGFQILLAVLQPLGAVLTGPLLTIGLVTAALVLLYTQSKVFRDKVKATAQGLADDLSGMFASIGTFLSTVWDSIKATWEARGQGLMDSIGGAVGSVIETVGSLVGNVIGTISSIFESLTGFWNKYGAAIFDKIVVAVTKIMDILRDLWERFVGPIIEKIGDVLEKLWTKHIKGLVDNILACGGEIASAVLSLWNNVMAPTLDFLINTFGPMVATVFNSILSTVGAVIGNIIDIVNGVVTVLKGIIEFIVGVFSGDWDKAWQGIKDIFKGIWDSLVGVVKIPLNLIIGFINALLKAFVVTINTVIGLVNKMSFTVPDWVPGLGGQKFGFNIPKMEASTIPYLENGAVVTGPTVAMIGEGSYDEAVVPLGNSPQLEDMLNRLVSKLQKSNTSTGGGVQKVQVFIGNEEWDTFTYKSAKRGEALVGAKPIKAGGY